MMFNIITIPYRILTGILIVGLLASGCNKNLEIDSSHLVNEGNNWKSITDTRSALLGTYGLLRAAMADNNGHWLYGDLRRGDFQATSRLDLKAIVGNNLNAPYPVVESLRSWRRFYAVINSASLFIERAHEVMAKDKQYTERNYKVDIAQMHALRAFAYFYMSRIWGDVPLITSSKDGSFENVARTPKSVVLGYAESELLKAVDNLPYKYGDVNDPVFPGLYYSQATANWSGVLLTKISAYAILAHIAAWNERYIDASGYASFVLTNFDKAGAAYTATANVSKYDGLFYDKKASQIFGLAFAWTDREASVVGHIEDLALAAPLVTKPVPQIYVPDQTILSIFNEDKDERFSINATTGRAVTDYFTNFGSSNTVFSKIKCIRDASSDGSLGLFSSAIVFTRLEEITLLYAESMAVIGNTQEAIDALDRIRIARGLPLYQGANDGVVDAIFKERQRELMGEGWRWYDQIRYNRIKKTNPEFNKLISTNGIFWPISEDVLSRNSLLVQNEYWR
ncbi:RagB/SusD family nutrient uptake outer membrane protein [Pedobacter frigoris]|uniref:RagB/SusD family nutrient uptake outer membrane protein n=1 Tax=Pedobacter frigoris TaxID=2571272 RepID=A0A4U1CGY8_9SPHI|nr:RagB/SusD family nutrient uptake outer membrane protein [Pedobacter frigoris]TKC05142.1 RagB/SusD family nutrient uptake outer membrane protein [Pedobacter frigoris]